MIRSNIAQDFKMQICALTANALFVNYSFSIAAEEFTALYQCIVP